MRPNTVEPEIIPPRRARTSVISSLDDETLNLLASLLDDMFRVPGTAIRFGLDPLIGLIPGIGDLISGLASFLIILAAWQRQLPRATVARMMTNVAVDTVIGAVPLLGDAFDLAWKSNRKNFMLLQRSSPQAAKRQTWRDWLFLGGVAIVLGLLVSVPIVVLWLVIHALGKR